MLGAIYCNCRFFAIFHYFKQRLDQILLFWLIFKHSLECFQLLSLNGLKGVDKNLYKNDVEIENIDLKAMESFLSISINDGSRYGGY